MFMTLLMPATPEPTCGGDMGGGGGTAKGRGGSLWPFWYIAGGNT